MARRSIEMHEYRQALMRLRQGDSEREIARSGLMGRAKAARFRTHLTLTNYSTLVALHLVMLQHNCASL